MKVDLYLTPEQKKAISDAERTNNKELVYLALVGLLSLYNIPHIPLIMPNFRHVKDNHYTYQY